VLGYVTGVKAKHVPDSPSVKPLKFNKVIDAWGVAGGSYFLPRQAAGRFLLILERDDFRLNHIPLHVIAVEVR